MGRKQIDLKHHLASGCCMWSGIEDVYATRLFHLCGKNIEAIVNYIIQSYLDGSECLEELQKLFIDTGCRARKAYELLKA